MMIRPKSFIHKALIGLLAAVMVLTSMMIAAPEALSQTQNNCAEELEKAAQMYREGYLDDAVDLLNRCLDKKGGSNQEKVEAYKLLGKIYIAKENREEEAKKAFWMALELNPELTLNSAEETPEVMKNFNEVKAAFAKQPQRSDKESQPLNEGHSKKWLWIGGGAAVVAAGITTVIVLSDGTEEGFTKPPGRPR